MMSEREGTTRRGVDGSSFGPTNYRFGSDSFGGRCSGQVYRLVIKYREDGGGALIHKGRGQASNHRLNPGLRTYADTRPSLSEPVRHGTSSQ